jgi:hypothetical protein
MDLMMLPIKTPEKVSLLSSDDEDMIPVPFTRKSPEKVAKIDDPNENGREDPEKEDPVEKERSHTPDLKFDNTTDDESKPTQDMSLNVTQIQVDKKIFDDKKFHLNHDLSATDKIKLERHILYLKGRIATKAEDADYVIANKAKHISKDIRAELVKPRWIQECFDMECWIPTKRYLLDC